MVRIISDNPIYARYERSAEEVTIVGRIRWLAVEISGISGETGCPVSIANEREVAV